MIYVRKTPCKNCQQTVFIDTIKETERCDCGKRQLEKGELQSPLFTELYDLLDCFSNIKTSELNAYDWSIAWEAQNEPQTQKALDFCLHICRQICVGWKSCSKVKEILQESVKK